MNFRTTETAEVEVNLTPLIDVVFLLLIFFMVTTTFEKESKIKMQEIGIPLVPGYHGEEQS